MKLLLLMSGVKIVACLLPHRTTLVALLRCIISLETPLLMCLDSETHPEQRHSQSDRIGPGSQHPEQGPACNPSSPAASSHHFFQYSPKCLLTVHRGESRSHFHLFRKHRGHLCWCNMYRRAKRLWLVHSNAVWRRGMA